MYFDSALIGKYRKTMIFRSCLAKLISQYSSLQKSSKVAGLFNMYSIFCAIHAFIRPNLVNFYLKMQNQGHSLMFDAKFYII